MASPPFSTQALGDRSQFKPTVYLYDWWLIKSEDNDGNNRLAVAGVSSAPQEVPRRVFNSAPISKKHDCFTLETTDGVTVILEGIINQQQTITNGFSDEIAKRFQLGFYSGWERGVSGLLAGDSNPNTNGVSGISDSGEGKMNSGLTSVHFSQGETRSPYEHVGSTYFQWNGRSKNLEGNQKDSMSRCSMTHKSSKLLPSLDAFDNVGEASGAAVQSGGKKSDVEKCPSNSARQVNQFLPEFWSKQRNQQLVGLTSEKNTMDSDLTISKTVNNSLQTEECDVGEKGVESSNSTSLHLSLEEGSYEQVSIKKMCDSEFLEQLSSRLSLDNSTNDLVNHAVEEEIGTDDFRSTGLQSSGIPKTLEENDKEPDSGCSIKHNITISSPSVDVGEVVSGGTIPLVCPRNSGGRVSGDLLMMTRNKSKTKKVVGNGLNSEPNTVNSVPAVESVSNTSQNVDYEVGGRQLFELFLSCCERAEGLLNSSPTSVHFAHETPNKKVQCEDRLDVEDPIQITTNLSTDSTINDSKIEDLMNHAPEVELDTENIGLTEFQSFGRQQTREENEKNPTSEPATEALEILDKVLDANAQSGEKLDIVGSPSQFAGRVSLLFSGIIRRKAKKKQTVGNGMNFETNTIDSVPAVSGSVNSPLENDSFETAGNGMSHPSDSELQEPVDVNVVRKLDFDFVEDDMQHTSNGEEEIHSIPVVNKKTNRTPSTAKVKNKNNGTPEVNKKRKASPSTMEVSKNKKSTPSTQEMNSKKEASLSTPKRTAHMSIISPESLSAGRSRSGRLRLPPLEFWRNQSPVYDKDRGVIGIQEELARATPSRGSLSELRKRKGNRG